jgi:hypothetical protein
MTAVQGGVASNCVTKLARDFGPTVELPYSPNAKADIFVVTSGGLGSVVVVSAKRSGNRITVTFADGGVCPGATSYFFGLASKATTPVAGNVTVSYSLGDSATTDIRVP